jgi:hypothetical protein
MSDDPQDGLDDPEEGDDLEEGQTTELPTRGLIWIIGPTLLGLLLGIAYKAVSQVRAGEGAIPLELASGAAVGAGVGLAVGAIIWAFFPYKSGTKTNRREE